MNPKQLKMALSAATAPIVRRLIQLVQRSVVVSSRYVDNIRLLQLKLPGGSAIDGIEQLEPFGFTSHAPDGAEAITIALGGNSSHSIVILVSDRRYRLVIDKGEMAIYNQFHDKVHIRKDRVIEMKSAVKVLVDSPLLECLQNLKVGGNAEIGGNQTVIGTSTAADHISDGISGKGHLHGGVQTGSGQTGAPVGGA